MLDKKLKILKDIFGKYYKSKNEYIFWCPQPNCKHHKPKLSINIRKNKFQCWVCEYQGKSIHKIVKRYGNYKQYQEWLDLTGSIDLSDNIFGNEFDLPARVDLPEEFSTLTGRGRPIQNLARQYLYSRGITKDDILRWKMGYCLEGDYKERIIIPSFDLNGDVNYFIARNYASDWFPYKNPPAPHDFVFNELYVDWTKDIVIVEGVFDAIKTVNPIPLLGSSIDENGYAFEKIVLSGCKVFSALDPQAIKKETRMINLFLSYGVEVYKIDVLPYKDVGEMTKEEFIERKKYATLQTRQSEFERLIASI